MIFEHENFSTYLKSVMSQKAARNPRFSMRAMASQLDIAPSFLFALLKKDKHLSPEGALKVAKKLGLSADETEYLRLLVQKDSTKDPELKEAVIGRIKEMNPERTHHDLTADHFRVISDWFHFAAMAATNLSDFAASPKNLSHALGIPQVDVELALERMERLEMVEKDEQGNYRKTLQNPRFSSPNPNQALRNFHKQTLNKAIESLESQSPQEKVVGSETFAIDREQVDAFRALADEFFDKALVLAKKAKKKDAVYHLGVQFFDFTPNLKRKKP